MLRFLKYQYPPPKTVRIVRSIGIIVSLLWWVAFGVAESNISFALLAIPVPDGVFTAGLSIDSAWLGLFDTTSITPPVSGFSIGSNTITLKYDKWDQEIAYKLWVELNTIKIGMHFDEEYDWLALGRWEQVLPHIFIASVRLQSCCPKLTLWASAWSTTKASSRECTRIKPLRLISTARVLKRRT